MRPTRIIKAPKKGLHCACCGSRILPEMIVDDIICPSCLSDLAGKDLAWSDFVSTSTKKRES